ncbi:MAG: LuxR C-terminal-related transcriptional regulator [Thermoanaerobaculia bacterium]
MGSGGDVALVATKLTPPTLPGPLVHRTRLSETLDAAVADPVVRVVLVSAPAGSGKSTLLASWHRQRSDGAWVQADAADRDPARFWGYVVGALATVVPAVEAAARRAVSAAGSDAGPLVERIAHELTVSEPVTLVIDDYHLIGNPKVDEALERLVELAPETFLLVLGTRVDPGLRLSRLRVRSQLVEIRADTLRFDAGEAHMLLDGRHLTGEQAASLCERTEGWAAGLVLAGLSLDRSGDRDDFVEAFQGDDRLVVDYLTDEFLAGVGEAERQRMLESSVLDEMTGPLIDAVCGSDDGARWLRGLAATNQLLIGLDNTDTAFRYHHLLRDLLLLEAEREIPHRLTDLHLAAARWHHEHGDTYRAIHHFISGHDLVTAGDLIAIHATELLNDGQIFTVLDLLERLGDLPERHSLSAATKGWLNFSTGRFTAARHYYDVAVANDHGTDGNLIAALGIMVNLAEGDLATALSIAATMSEPVESTQAIGLAAAHTWAGQFDQARRYIAVARELGASEPSDYATAVAPGFAAVLGIESADPIQAAADAEASLSHAADRGIADAPQLSIAHAVVARTTTEPRRRETASARAIELIRRAPEPFTHAYVHALVADTALQNGDPDGARLLAEAQRSVDACPDPGIAGRMVARVASRHGQTTRPTTQAGIAEELTDRELAVLRYLPSPLSQRDIAAELFVSLNTVKTHCRAIYRKLAATDRKAAVQAARDAGLL